MAHGGAAMLSPTPARLLAALGRVQSAFLASAGAGEGGLRHGFTVLLDEVLALAGASGGLVAEVRRDVSDRSVALLRARRGSGWPESLEDEGEHPAGVPLVRFEALLADAARAGPCRWVTLEHAGHPVAMVAVRGLEAGEAALAETLQPLLDTLRMVVALRQEVWGRALAEAAHDPLTGLLDRRVMTPLLSRELARAARAGRTLALLMVDIDHFKRVNDAFGHAVGDIVLHAVAACLLRSIRQGDLAFRYGGEEFLLALPEADLASVMRRAESIRLAVRALELTASGRPVGRVTVSIGVAAFPLHGAQVGTLLLAADAAMYRAKRAGRDRVEEAGA
jgi:diguanylate cyclase (GGDEF)-like protein